MYQWLSESLSENSAGRGITPMSTSDALQLFFPLVVFGVLLLCVNLTALALCEHEERTHVIGWCIAGFLAGCIKIWLIQLTPQWMDTSLDSKLYQLHSQAFALHWQGASVDAIRYKLDGFLAYRASGLGLVWAPDMKLAYGSVLGTHEWLYAAFLGGWRMVTEDWFIWATYSNAALASLFPTASFGIARCLGGSIRVASVAATVALVDPSTGVNASWLLKDTLAGFFAVAAIWGVLRILQKNDGSAPLVLFATASGLACVRFAGFVALLLAVALVATTLLERSRQQALKCLTVCVMGSLLLFGVMYSSPQNMSLRSVMAAMVQPIKAQESTLNAGEGQLATDQTVVDWQSRFSENPPKAITTSVARTLFAPYPWVMLTQGLSWTNSVELYYPGVLLWIACLPGIFWGIRIVLHRLPREGLFLGGVFLALLGAYTVFLGEWSTRQRVFMLPVFFSFAAIGWHDIYTRSKVKFSALRDESLSRPTDS